jgi:RluA family pseudouridine synthase
MTGEMVTVVKNIEISGEWAGLTVLEAVRRVFPELSPREIFKKARTGEIKKGGRPADPLGKVAGGDIVSVAVLRPKKPSTKPVLRENEPVSTPAGPFTVVREDEDLLVVSKPPGCASHPALRRSGDTLIERVRHYLGTKPEDEFQPALANRLDIETSGLVLIGKNPRAQRKLGFHLQQKRFSKKYLALVAGRVECDEGRIELELEKRPDSRAYAKLGPACLELEPKIQAALTLYRVLGRAAHPLSATLVEIELLTGRNHQIRRHFAHLGHPVALDPRYGDRGFNRDVAEVSELSRMFLHAFYVGMEHPATGERLEIFSDLPAELLECLRVFGLAAALSAGISTSAR